MKKGFIVSFIALLLSVNGAESSSLVRLQPGKMSLLDFSEMVSNVLGIQINASALESKESESVTVPDSRMMDRKLALDRFRSILSEVEYTALYDADLDTYRLVRGRFARDENTPVFSTLGELPRDNQLVNYTFSLRFFPAESMARAIRSFSPASSRIIPDPASNRVLITDVASHIPKYQEIAERLDTKETADEVTEKNQIEMESKANWEKENLPVPPASVKESRLFLVLFTLIGVICGFLIRGYAIRKIEGGF